MPSKDLLRQDLLKRNRLLSTVNRYRRVSVVGDLVAVRDPIEDLVALDDVQPDTFDGAGKNAEDHVVLGHDNAQCAALVFGHLDEMTGFVREPTQCFKINHTRTPHNKLNGFYQQHAYRNIKEVARRAERAREPIVRISRRPICENPIRSLGTKWSQKRNKASRERKAARGQFIARDNWGRLI
ncbi:MAG TPA: hypothetical protein VKR55_16040 [Bradyrhizobium sp.]|uniref:hypothetical protein n=1 Tax=Bradyrhizobium sp. TaxID=376 RepID=UPI002C827942|nr:hypothetical protein [Bradyrhizobium sp.]HLZ03645.1 hypothetical protein [Bradyrhizobium sp.]